MAKQHYVICYYCNERFDANSEPYVMPTSRRYAHKSCHEAMYSKEELKRQQEKKALEEYIKKLFGYGSIPAKIDKQIQSYIHNYNYTYSGILKTLKYFFEVRKNPIEKANDGIGIVVWAYDEAFKYWYAIQEAQQKNEVIDMRQYLLPAREVHITPPQREPMRHVRKLFTFLEEDNGE